jgi:galactokinase
MSDALAYGDHCENGRLALDSFDGVYDLYEIVSSEMRAMREAVMGAPGVYCVLGPGSGFGDCMLAFVAEEAVDSFTDVVQQQYAESTGINAHIYPAQAT